MEGGGASLAETLPAGRAERGMKKNRKKGSRVSQVSVQLVLIDNQLVLDPRNEIGDDRNPD